MSANAVEVRGVLDQAKLKQWGVRGVELRSYQRDGVDWMIAAFHRRHGAILADEMGLGKTCQTIAFLAYLSSEEQMQESHLVLSPLSVLHTWKEELAKVVPSFSVKVYNGDKEARLAIQQDLSCQHFDILLTTYELCLRDASFFKRCSWGLLVVDEGHRLKNVTSLLREALLEVPCASRILLTGTPVQNSLNELHSLLSFVAPLAYPPAGLSVFCQQHCMVDTQPDHAEALRSSLQPYLLRRVKADVAGELPPRSEVVLFHGLSTLQTRCYRAILARDMEMFDHGVASGSRARLLNTLMQLRKCICHPYLFDGIEPEPFEEGEHIVTASGKLVILDRLLAHLQASGHRVLLFSQMTRMLDILQDYLEFRGYSYERLDGSMRSEERHLAIKSFSRDARTFVFLLSTRAGGVGLTLTEADTVIFSDSDFNPQNDLQAAARAHRLGQERPVKIIRLVSQKTVEEAMLKRAVAKLALSQAVVGGSGGGQDDQDPGNVGVAQLMSLLTIGLDSLLEQAESPLPELDLESVLGRSNRGCWVIEGDTNFPAGLGEADEIDAMNGAEGVSASGATLGKLRQFLDAVGPEARLMPLLPEGRASRGSQSEEEFEKVTKKRQESAKKRQEQAEKRQAQRIQEKIQKRQTLWKDNGYCSCNIELLSEAKREDERAEGTQNHAEQHRDDEEEEEGSSLFNEWTLNQGGSIQYLIGDVTRPDVKPGCSAIIIHCVDNSGCWGHGGIFRALDSCSPLPHLGYSFAGRMSDLTLGDAHLIELDEDEDEDQRKIYVALIVAQHRAKAKAPSAIQLPALALGLRRVSCRAKSLRASVHLPRIGHATPAFNWYGTERLIRKHLASCGIPTFIYYYPRKMLNSVEHTGSDSSPTSLSSESGQDVPQTSKRLRTSTDCSCTTTASLPDFMAGIKVHFVDLPPEQQHQLSRYLIAYDGDVAHYVDEDVTHVVIPTDCTLDTSRFCFHLQPGTWELVQSAWLETCFKRQQKVSTQGFVVPRNLT